jgi:uncharacterized protein YodC (DUF2158 family)
LLIAQIIAEFEITPPSCFGNSDASIHTLVTGDNPPFQLSWSTGEEVANLNQLVAGTYTLNIVDHNGFSLDTSLFIADPLPLDLNLDFTGSICFNPGNVRVLVEGGTTPYQLLWSDGGTEMTRTGLERGMYHVEVFDANGCTVVDSIFVPDLMEIDIRSIDAGCWDGSGGQAEAIVEGGVGPYSYFWMNGSETSYLTDLIPGNYTVFAFDQNGCVASANTSIDSVAPIFIDLQVVQPDCQTLGSISSLVLEEETTLQFAWNTGDTLSFLNNLEAGLYTLTVSDNAGCFVLDSIELFPATDLTAAIEFEQNCETGKYEAAIQISGGAAPYELFLADSLIDTVLVDLEANTVLNWQIEDSLGCSLEFIDTIPEFKQITLSGEVANPKCADSDDGSIHISPDGGLAPYQFSWSNGAMTGDIVGLPSGNYQITVTDEESCPATDSFNLQSPDLLNCALSVLQAISFPGADDAQVKAEASGGTLPYSFDWSAGGSETEMDDLSAGVLSVTVTDANDCSCVCTVALEEPAMIGDFVWIDQNENGLQDTNEPGLRNVHITLTGESESGQAIVKDTLSDSNGHYSFIVPSGDYVLHFEQPEHFLITEANVGMAGENSIIDAVSGTSPSFSLESGTVLLDLDAGFVPKCKNVEYAGLIEGTQTICGPGAAVQPILNIESPEGGQGALEYMWIQSIDNGQNWTKVEGAHEAGLIPGLIAETTHFIRCVRRADCSTYRESNIVTITVLDEAIAAIELPDLPICAGEMIVFQALENGPAAQYSWNFGPGALPMFAEGAEVEVEWNNFGMRTIELQVYRNGCLSRAIETLMITTGEANCSEAPLEEIRAALSATKFQNNEQWRIYPNPVKERFRIEYTSPMPRFKQSSFRLLSLSGQELQINAKNEEMRGIEIDISHLPDGIYFLEWTNGSEKYWQKIVKLR